MPRRGTKRKATEAPQRTGQKKSSAPRQTRLQARQLESLLINQPGTSTAASDARNNQPSTSSGKSSGPQNPAQNLPSSSSARSSAGTARPNSATPDNVNNQAVNICENPSLVANSGSTADIGQREVRSNGGDGREQQPEASGRAVSGRRGNGGQMASSAPRINNSTGGMGVASRAAIPNRELLNGEQNFEPNSNANFNGGVPETVNNNVPSFAWPHTNTTMLNSVNDGNVSSIHNENTTYNNTVSGNNHDNYNNTSISMGGAEFGRPFVSMTNTGIDNMSARPLSMLTSVCTPLGTEIPQPLKDKIKKGDFVDFGLLLPKVTSGSSQSEMPLGLTLNASGQIVMQEAKPQAKINTINAWTDAFLVFAAIYLQSHPQRVQEILKYGNIIRTAHTRFGGWGWRSYDENFRLRQSAHPENSWAVIDGELWSMLVVVPINMTGGPTSNGGFRGRGSFQKRGQRSAGRGQNAAARGGICFNFNKGTCYHSTYCKFRHICTRCRKEGHGISECTQKATKGGPTP